MIRTILSILAIAAMLSTAASRHVLGNDFNVWNKNLGAPGGKKGSASQGGWPSKIEISPPGKSAEKKAQPRRKPLLQQPAINGNSP